MKKLYRKIQWKIRKKFLGLYFNLSNKLRDLLPEELDPVVSVIPDKDGADVIMIRLRIPHSITKKLMWSFKVWKKN